MPADALFDVKTAFYIGNYQACINEAQGTKVETSEEKCTLDVFMYRSYIALKKYGLVLDELKSYSGPDEVRDLRLLAEFLSEEPSNRTASLSALEKRLGSFSPDNVTLPIVAATIYLHQNDPENALKVLYNCDTLEAIALSLQCYLQLNRLDLATKEMKRMMVKDEDAPLTQLCSGWLHLYMGGDKLQEAMYTFTEMGERHGKTPLLAVGIASVLIAQGKFEEADECLAESLEKDPNHVETVINQIVVSQFLGKSPEEYQAKEQEFESLCQSFTP